MILTLGYVKHGMFQKAIDLFRHVEEASEVNTLLLFNACARLGTKEALALVKKVSSTMPSSFHTHPNVTNSLIDAYVKCHDLESARQVFDQSKTREPAIYSALMKGMMVGGMHKVGKANFCFSLREA